MSATYDISGIPEEMACLRGWLFWVGKKIPKTLTKDPLTGKSNHNNRDCLASLEEVLDRIEYFTCVHGLAFAFRREYNLTYVDLDDCRNAETGELTEFASDIVRRLDSYTEVSIGQKGLHVVTRGQVERPRLHTKRKWSGKQIEIKPHDFYMTVSGNHLAGTPRRVEERHAELAAIYYEIFGKDEPEPPPSAERRKEPARKTIGVDLSGRDFAVCCSLGRFGMTSDEIEDFLRDHPCMAREKWTKRPEYRRRTISAALKSVRDTD